MFMCKLAELVLKKFPAALTSQHLISCQISKNPECSCLTCCWSWTCLLFMSLVLVTAFNSVLNPYGVGVHSDSCLVSGAGGSVFMVLQLLIGLRGTADAFKMRR
ncbi:hypothetical protein CHARACLAT_009460 [Characodon lateralis]|uniref:Uncharacterized protein n=1 Tax=Characodon lateralis TaxID=208331 RepID=A0ABU7DFB2_9TELE|nr:hypothetical protein [Characodon lateralis]